MGSRLPVRHTNDQSWISNDEVGLWTPVRRRRLMARHGQEGNDNVMVESQGGASKAGPPEHRDLAASGRLGGVIFGCTDNTYMGSVTKNTFCMSHFHWAYVKHIKQGMPLFLFNYFDRNMIGVFEAVSNGELNFSSENLIQEGTNCRGYSRYPAQVGVRLRPGFPKIIAVPETVYQKTIANNYWSTKHFQFELDNDQTRNLVKLFESRAGSHLESKPSSVPKTVATQLYSVVNGNHTNLNRGAKIEEKSVVVEGVSQTEELKVPKKLYPSFCQLIPSGEQCGSLITPPNGSSKHEPFSGDEDVQNFADILEDEQFPGAKYVIERILAMVDNDPSNLQERAAL